MTHHTTTYNKSGNTFLPLGEVRRVLLLLIMLMMGVGSAWGQDPTPDKWDGSIANNANNKFAENGITLQDPGQPNSESNPYTIDNAQEFAYFMRIVHEKWTGYGSAYYWKLTTDIDLNNITWAHGSNTNNSFQGHFDGGGHTVSNVSLPVTTNSNYGLFPTIQGASATSLAEVKNLKIDGVTFISEASRANDTRWGALAGTARQAIISNVTISNVSFTFSNTITGNTRVGGAIGYLDTYTTLDDVDISVVSITAPKTTTNLYFGGVVGQLVGDKITVKGSSASNVTASVATEEAATVNGIRVGGFIGYVESNNTTSKAHIKGNTASTVSITVDGNTTGTPYIGGFIGQAKGKASPDNRSTIEGNTVTSPTVTMNGVVANTFYMGGFLGYADAHTDVFNNKVATSNVSITNNITAATYVGGAVGAQANYTTIDGMTVNGGSISGPTEDKTLNNNVAFFVGGFIGMQNSSGTTAYQPNKFKNVAVSNMTINLAHYVPGGTINNHKFGVGGIAGTVNAPNQDANGLRGMPENLISKGVKIYAPFAATSPTVANFSGGIATQTTYTSDNVTNVDAIERSKRGSWLYTDYQLGLSKSVLAGTNAYNATSANGKVKRNFSKSTTDDQKDKNLEWLAIDDNTFLKKNRQYDFEYESWTVLWWTRTDNNASFANNDIDQTLYPRSDNKDIATFADSDWKYYMYFYQGISNAKYVSVENAAKIIEGIEANVTEAAKDEPLALTIINDKEGKRGFATRTLSVSASASVDSYQWYVDGESAGTGTSIEVTPDWKLGKNIHVNAIKDGKIVASAAYALKAGVFKTKNSDNEVIAIADRGTASNPYIIDSQEALRQLSYLSTLSTSILWDGLSKPASPYPTNQSQGHYNRAYYELGNDITMSSEPFIPISHVGTNSDGSNGTYAQNWIFQGSFDGNRHTISGLNITWGAGQYNGNDANVYNGLFGAVGNPTATAKWGENTTSSTVIKNLIISNATLTHDINNTSFYYSNGTSGNSNNCMVGVLVGLVSANTTIQNIEIRKSKITDEGSINYSLATRGLYVGGVIGSLQNIFGGNNNTKLPPAHIKMQHIAAQVDFTLTHPTFVDNSAVAQLNQFVVGGIIGRYIATDATAIKDVVQKAMPAYTFYSGTINAPSAWISPVLASLRYNSQQGNSWANYSKQWEGNNNAAGTQLTITNAQYYKFSISSQPITDLFPTNICGNNARSIVEHEDGNEKAATYNAKKYQGVNYGARYIDSDETTLYFMNQEPADDVYWAWDNDFPHMTHQKPTEAYIDRGVGSYTLKAEMTEGTGSEYRWQISYDGVKWDNVDGATLQTLNANPSNKTKLIVAYVTSGVTEYRTQVEVIYAGSNPFDVHIEKIGDSASGYTFNVVWKDGIMPSGTQSINYQWYHSNQTTPFVGETGTSLSLTQDELDAAGGYIWCAIEAKEGGITVYKWMLIAGDLNVVYVNGNGYTGNSAEVGDDTNDGMTPQTPVLTIDKANSLLDGGPWDKNIIVVMGLLNNDADFRSNGKNPATLTGKWDGTDYEGIIKLKQINPSGGENTLNPIAPGVKGSNCYVQADTKFEYLTFQANSNTDGNNFIELHGNDVWFGKGLVMTNFANLSKNHGNLDAAQNIPELTIILTATNLNEVTIQKYTYRTKPQVVTFESGRYGRIMGGRYTNGFFAKAENTSHTILGSAEHPVWAVVNIDIDKESPNKGTVNRKETPNTGVKTDDYTCDINCIIAGLTDGTMYGDYTINVHGGKIGYIVGGNQGNPVPNGSKTFTQPGGISGNWGQWPNSSYFGRTVINVEQDLNLKDISIASLYAGGLGREANGDAATSIVDMYMYGHTEINMKSGTLLGNIYGGGAGGVIGLCPWDMHVPYATTESENVDYAIMNGVQYGEWGDKKAGSPLANVTLHDSDDNGGYITNDLNLGESYTTLNISGGTINGSVYGGGCGYVSNMPKEVVMQGVGSVFGTSNVTISGGTIHGSVYGGSEGSDKYYNATNKYGQTITHIAEINGTVNLKVIGTDAQYPTIDGNIYGAGMGIASKSTTEEYLRIATAGNYDLAGSGATDEQKNKYKTDIKILIDLPESHPFQGNIYGGGQMGAVDGSTTVVIKGGTFEKDIFGGGKGEPGHPDKAKVTGDTKVIVDKDWTESEPEPDPTPVP